jgi:hypothetical protein
MRPAGGYIVGALDIRALSERINLRDLAFIEILLTYRS